ncbi:MAG: hypothetical protein ABI367_03005 [Mucilaginibacter sp.]
MCNGNTTIKLFLLSAFLVSYLTKSSAQSNLKIIKLPAAINNVNEEFSGLVQYRNRVYLLPQYGDHKETKLSGAVNIYSLSADSINRAIEGKDSLHYYRTLKIKNLAQLPNEIADNYQGFEAISIVNQQVYLSIETADNYYYCYLLKGKLDTVKNEINIDSHHFIRLRRYPYIENAGFESLAYLPKQKKLIAYYEFNAMPSGGLGYLIDPAFKKPPTQVKAPFFHFRITDITATNNGRIFGINYYWNGDYNSYLNNGIISNQEDRIKLLVPDLKDSLNRSPDYLKNTHTTYARIVTLKNYHDKKWRQVASFDGFKNNWEGITLFKKGALIITDANRSNKQLTTFGYVEF